MKLKDSVNDDNFVMLKCNLCKNWFHYQCLGFDKFNLKFYFDAFSEFSCLDCHMSEKYGDRYMEVTVNIFFNQVC